MNERCLRALKERRDSLHIQWEVLLRAYPYNSPLGNPDTLVHLISRTLDQIFHELEHPSARRRQPALSDSYCRCGHNPLLIYFKTALMAFQAILAQYADEEPVTQDDADEVNRTITRIGRSEIMTFCGLCRLQSETTPTKKCPNDNSAQTPTA